MSKKISRRRFVSGLSVLGATSSASLVMPTALANNGSGIASPDPEHVIPRGAGWRVIPTSGDDRSNIEWALSNTQPGATVKLGRGTFKLSAPIVVADFDGRLVGNGPEETTLTCTDEYSYEIWEAPGGGRDNGKPKPPPFPRVPVNGSSTLSAPALIVFYKTPLQPWEDPVDRANKIVIRNLRCRGSMLGTPWMFGDEVLCINIINSFDFHNPEAVHETTRQDVVVVNVKVDGYSSPELGPFENACACITILGGIVATSNYNLNGDIDGDALGFANGGLLDVIPAEGDVTIRDCEYVNCRFGPGVVGVKNSTLVWDGNSTDGCRANCLQVIDNSNCEVRVRDNDLRCDSFILPPFLAGGATDSPSSLGCVVAFQGMAAATGFPANVQWLSLATDPAAHAAHPEAGPLGTWRPRGPASAPQMSKIVVSDNHCESSETPNTYCYHIVDAANLAFAMPTADVVVRDNSCEGAQTCISLEHVNDGVVRDNECSAQQYGVELYNSFNNRVVRNDFSGGSTGCELRTLSLGEKIDLSRVVPGAGICTPQA